MLNKRLRQLQKRFNYTPDGVAAPVTRVATAPAPPAMPSEAVRLLAQVAAHKRHVTNKAWPNAISRTVTINMSKELLEQIDLFLAANGVNIALPTKEQHNAANNQTPGRQRKRSPGQENGS